MKFRRLIITSCLLITAVTATSATHAQDQQGPPPAVVRVGEVKVQQVQHQRLVTGGIEPAKRSVVSAEQAGRVIQDPPEPGVAVKQGDVLAKVDATLLKSELAAAEAEIHEAQADLAQARAQLDIAARSRKQLEDLVAANSARQKELDDARDQEQVAESRVRLAEAMITRLQARRDRLQQQIDKTVIHAPFDGYISRKQTELGQWLNPGDPVTEMVATARVKAKLNVPQDMIDLVPTDEPITLTVEPIQLDVTEKIFSIVPDGDAASRTFRVLLKLDSRDGRIKPGMSVSAPLPTGRSVKAVTVPRDAVNITPTGKIVYVNRNGTAAAVNVNIRFGAGDRFVVDGALNDGEQVVVEGNERLFPGQPLKIATDSPIEPETTRAEAQ